jgi:hypothetical protein
MRASGRPGLRRAGAAAVVVTAAVLTFGAAVGAAPSDVSTTTTAPPDTTTTVPATTTTTVPPTTTTTVPPTTTSTSTSTTEPPTTTTAVPKSTTPTSTPWGLIVLIVVLVVAIVVVALLLRSRKKRAVETQWRRAVTPALSDAQLARQSLLSGNAESDDDEVRAAVALQVERAAVALERTVSAAPDDEAGSMATGAAASLRGLAFAIEADRLLRQGTSAPSGVQLAQADDARRARSTELQAALVRLSTRMGSGTANRGR